MIDVTAETDRSQQDDATLLRNNCEQEAGETKVIKGQVAVCQVHFHDTMYGH